MPKGYHHLTYEQRCQIYTLKETSNKSSTEIAKIIGVHRSSVIREIKRNSESKHYDYIIAQAKSTNRKSKRFDDQNS